ncbi:hypothetical protein CmeUKMEL1_17440 [Cryptosporidium meleagridis]|uniref:OB-fold nucleic acid binding domain protein n=1 Tax=Cryptosporidium meleagridis TaxID=93969 RepID=A0A2P4Z5W2_9CRYT|nr:hypothetical protein CmeUKMEL1_17440 [Cryptosporidium meleagridis]
MLGRGEDNVNDKDNGSLEDNVSCFAEDELAEIVLLQEVYDLGLEKKKIRVAGIVKFVDLIEQEIAIFYESRSLRVSLRNLKKPKIQSIEKGSKVEVIGYIINQKGFNACEQKNSQIQGNLVIIAQVVRSISEANLYFHQLSVILRRKILNSVNII